MFKHKAEVPVRRITISATLAVIAVAATAPLASATTRTIRLTERQTYYHETDNAPSGPSASDVITIRGVLLRDGRAVGNDAVRCSGDRHCSAKLSFDAGSISAGGVQTGRRFTVPITGGSGRFAGARGTVTVTMTPTGSRYSITVR
jgi:hypothetical protein